MFTTSDFAVEDLMMVTERSCKAGSACGKKQFPHGLGVPSLEPYPASAGPPPRTAVHYLPTCLYSQNGTRSWIVNCSSSKSEFFQTMILCTSTALRLGITEHSLSKVNVV